VTDESNEYKLALHVVVQQAVEIEQLKNALAQQVARCLELQDRLDGKVPDGTYYEVMKSHYRGKK